MADDSTAVVTIDKVDHNVATGWFNIHARSQADGSKMRFSTKFEDKAQEAAALMGKPGIRIWYTEKPSRGINPHTNQPYPPDLWYGRAELGAASSAPIPSFAGAPGNGGIEQIGGAVQQQLGALPPPIPAAPARGEDPERNWRICLQTGGKLAVATMPLMPNEQRSFDTQKQIALAWAKFFFFTPMPVEVAGVPVLPHPVPTPQEAYENVPAAVGSGYDSPPPPTDDDIPY